MYINSWLAVSEESAMGEPAWEGAGQEVGTKIWRIVVSSTLYRYCRLWTKRERTNTSTFEQNN